MGTPELLLHLITDLQRDMTIQRGRRTLLLYAHHCSGARLALLFALDSAQQSLVLLGRSGQRLQSTRSPFSTNTAHKQAYFIRKRLPLHGLFGAALATTAFQQLTYTSNDPRCLPEEQYWLGEDSAAICYPLGNRQGLLVLCFDSLDSPQLASSDEEGVRICATLLSAYLSTTEREQLATPLAQPVPAFSEPLTLQSDESEKPDSETTPVLPASYEVHLQTAIDQERNRIARDLHDGTAQQIAHVLHKLEFIQRILQKQPEVALHEINRTALLLKESLNDLRHGITSLIPVELEKQEFASALQTLLDEHAHDEPFLTIRYEGADLSLLPLSLEAVIFRFIQEGLNNVRKHARASQVVVRIRILAHLLTVAVSDNGCGFDVSQIMGAEQESSEVVQHLGLRTMHDRTLQAGGTWEIESKAGEGTTVKASFFLQTPPVALTNREREVLQLLAEGLTNRAIAEKLFVSVETVKSHVHHIMQKMAVNDRTSAAVEATKQHLL